MIDFFKGMVTVVVFVLSAMLIALIIAEGTPKSKDGTAVYEQM
jgi:hypothetical protein